ncbi:cytochrome P450 [Photorhabdus africana]|uniref:cytochrome P450 n=1 Tax=Photorhabdus africana TaxID=3097554 RepID=UPI002B41789C|nr:cytochrome P450 [Photorhabdus sp. CRI-LC]
MGEDENNRNSLGSFQQAAFSMVAATAWQSCYYRLLTCLKTPFQLVGIFRNSQALRCRCHVYAYIKRKAALRDGSLRRFLRLTTFAGDYCFLIGADEIRGLMQYPRLEKGELIGEGRQLYMIADALGHFRMSKERQDAKQKRNILTHLVSDPKRYVQTMQALSQQLVTSWQAQRAPFSVQSSLSTYTVEVYLRTLMNFQGNLNGVSEILERQIELLGQALVYRKAADFNEQFQQLKRQLVKKIGNDVGLLSTTDYTDRLSRYIDQHYKSIQDEAFATGLNGAVLAGYMAPFPSFIALVYELGRHIRYQQELREERSSFDGNYQSYICRDDTLLHACVHEVLRLHPAQPFIFRATTCDALINGHFVRKGTELIANVYHVQRCPLLWGNEPNTFQPHRFLDKPELYRHPFLVYSSGPNNCIGQMFSRLSLKVLLAELVDGLSWQVSNGEVEHEFHFALSMGQSMMIQVTECKYD